MFNATQPLSLPKGSIRAIFLIIFSLYIFISLFLEKAILEHVLDFWIALVSFYFGLRSEFGNTKKNE